MRRRSATNGELLHGRVLRGQRTRALLTKRVIPCLDVTAGRVVKGTKFLQLREELGVTAWTVLGQSFGGFTALHYLSTHPESLTGALITGGLSAVQRPVDEVYAATWRIMIDKSEAYYRRFPGDRGGELRHARQRAIASPPPPRPCRGSPERLARPLDLGKAPP